jgi:hypothetical protein
MSDEHKPHLSIIVWGASGLDRLPDLMLSIRRQTWRPVETIVVIEEASGIHASITSGNSQNHARVVVIPSGVPLAVQAAFIQGIPNGEWIAVLEAADLIHPERFARLIPEGERAQVDVIVDDCLYIADVPKREVSTLLPPGTKSTVGLWDEFARQLTASADSRTPTARPIMRSATFASVLASFETASGTPTEGILSTIGKASTMPCQPRADLLSAPDTRPSEPARSKSRSTALAL